MKFWGFAIILAVIGFGPSAAQAHHGVADYDYRKTVIAKVKVTRFEWANPHCKIHFDATDNKGKVEEWVIEAHPPSNMTEHGWTRQSLRPGDEVTLHFRPGKYFGPDGLLIKAELQDGQELLQNLLLLPVGDAYTLAEWQKVRDKTP
jgi:Family of unknown function (DUF6152)